jgi:hypothetical protein
MQRTERTKTAKPRQPASFIQQQKFGKCNHTNHYAARKKIYIHTEYNWLVDI